MQNAFGLIKIGRSRNSEKRRALLQQQLGCAVALVWQRPYSGLDEERIHLALRAHHLSHEWFKGTEGAKRAIVRVLKMRMPPAWPYELDEREAKIWVRKFLKLQSTTSLRALQRKAIKILMGSQLGLGRLKSFTDGSHHLDAIIWRADRLGRTCRLGEVVSGYDPDFGSEQVVGHFTTDLVAAMTLWPPLSNSYKVPVMPPTASMSPLTCCIAALAARWNFDVAKLTPASSF